MSKESSISFENWIRGIFAFDSWQEAADQPLMSWMNNPRLNGQHFVRLAAEGPSVLESLPNHRIGVGLDWLTNPGSGDILGDLYRLYLASPQGSAREELLSVMDAVATFGETLIPLRCDTEANPCESTNSIEGWYYMYWDVVPLWPSDDPWLFEACLERCARVLRVDHVACQYHALHGLGEFTRIDRDRPREVIDAWLGTNPKVKSYVLEYAKHARIGMIQ